VSTENIENESVFVLIEFGSSTAADQVNGTMCWMVSHVSYVMVTSPYMSVLSVNKERGIRHNEREAESGFFSALELM
jgi:hypothetical protein